MAKRMYSFALRGGTASSDEEIVEKYRRIAETIQRVQEIKKEKR